MVKVHVNPKNPTKHLNQMNNFPLTAARGGNSSLVHFGGKGIVHLVQTL